MTPTTPPDMLEVVQVELGEILSADTFNTFTALSGGDSPSGRLMFQPDPENIARRVHVAVVDRPAIAALPGPYSKRAQAFRAAGRNSPAARARLGTVSLVSFDKHSSVPSGFVAEHVSEFAPTGVVNGFRHPRLCQFRSAHIADDDQTIFPSDLGRLLVKVVTPGVRDLRVNGPRPFLVTGALSDAQRRLVLPIMTQGRDRLSVAECRQSPEPKVNSDLAISGRQIVGHVAIEADTPTASSVLHKTSVSERSGNFAGFPEGVPAFQVNGSIAFYPGRARYERNPAQRTLRAKAGSKPRAPAVQLSRLDELKTNLRHGVRVNAQVGRNTLRQSAKIERSRPTNIEATAPSPLGFSLGGNAEVPNLITGNRLSPKVPVSALDAVFETQERHLGILAVSLACINRPDTVETGA